jgi:hypothetical protein
MACIHCKDQTVNLVQKKIAVGGGFHKNKQYRKDAGKIQSFGVTDGSLCSNNLCLKVSVSNLLSSYLYYTARGHFVNYVCTIKIAHYLGC